MNQEDARAQIASLQQLRTHWSSIITNHLALALTINIGIISFFLKAFIDSMNNTNPEYSHLFALSALTSILFGLWRLYAHYMDNSITSLYPDFLKCEKIIGLSETEGTMHYLWREIKRARCTLDDTNISHDQKIKFLTNLVNQKRINTRGHLTIDIFSLIVQITLAVWILIIGSEYMKGLDYFLTVLSFIGIIITIIAMLRFQKWTREKDIEKAKENI